MQPDSYPTHDPLPEAIGGFIDGPETESAVPVSESDLLAESKEAEAFLESRREAEAIRLPAEDEIVVKIRERARLQSQALVRDIADSGLEVPAADFAILKPARAELKELAVELL